MFIKQRALLFLTITVILSLFVTACGSPQPSDTLSTNNTEEAPASAVEQSAKGVTIVIAEDPPSFNPMVADTGYDALVL